MCAFLKELGLEHRNVVFKGDQEAALGDLLQEVVEQSPVASSASNGVIERGNLSVEGQVRVLKVAFEARLGKKVGKKVPSDHAALAWLVEFALINRYEVGHDVRTPYERLRGKSSKLLGLKLGERLHFRRCPAAGRMAKLDGSWQDGVNILGVPVVERQGSRGDRGGRAEDEDRAQATRGAAVDQRLSRHGGRFALETEPERRPRRGGDASDRHADGRVGVGDQEARALRE